MRRAYLLDADRDERFRLAGLLRLTGEIAVVGMAGDPHRALEEIGALRPDLLFLELQLPSLHGIVLAELVRESQPQIEIVVVTGSAKHALWAFDNGIADYVVKPFDGVRIAKTLERLGIGPEESGGAFTPLSEPM